MDNRKHNRLRWIGGMMILSQVLLLVFVALWVKGQYQNEKARLQSDLSLDFLNSRQEVLDTLLHVKYIEPLLKNKKDFKVQFEIQDSSRNQKVEYREMKIRNHEVVTDNIFGPDASNSQTRKTISINGDSSDDLLMHGVKMFISELDDLPEDSFSGSVFKLRDTLLLQKALHEKLRSKGLNFNLRWTGHTNNIPAKSKFYFDSRLLPDPYGVEVENYSGYLFKQISPQLFSGIALLLLTASAFIISFRSLKQQYKLNAFKNDLISNISHELKTPVATVKVALEALQERNPALNAAKQQEYLKMATLENERLSQLIDKVMDTSVLESEKQIIHKSAADVKTLIGEVVNAIHMQYRNLNPVIHCEFEDGDLFAYLDIMQMKGVLMNLLDNSMKYSGGDPEIRIHVSKVQNGVVMHISDQGPGIPKEYESKVFEKFFRISNGDTHNVKGYGIGLYYASQVVKQHGGSIAVKNNAGHGCTFTIMIPVS